MCVEGLRYQCNWEGLKKTLKSSLVLSSLRKSPECETGVSCLWQMTGWRRDLNSARALCCLKVLCALQAASVWRRRTDGFGGGTVGHTAGELTECEKFSELKTELNPLKPSGHYMYRTVVTICTVQWSLYVPPV